MAAAVDLGVAAVALAFMAKVQTALDLQLRQAAVALVDMADLEGKIVLLIPTQALPAEVALLARLVAVAAERTASMVGVVDLGGRTIFPFRQAKVILLLLALAAHLREAILGFSSLAERELFV